MSIKKKILFLCVIEYSIFRYVSGLQSTETISPGSNFPDKIGDLKKLRDLNSNGL